MAKTLTPFAAWKRARNILTAASSPGADFEALASGEAELLRDVLVQLRDSGDLGRTERSLVRAALHVVESKHPRWG